MRAVMSEMALLNDGAGARRVVAWRTKRLSNVALLARLRREAVSRPQRRIRQGRVTGRSPAFSGRPDRQTGKHHPYFLPGNQRSGTRPSLPHRDQPPHPLRNEPARADPALGGPGTCRRRMGHAAGVRPRRVDGPAW